MNISFATAENLLQNYYQLRIFAKMLFQILENNGIPTGPVRFVEELFDDPQIKANGLVSQSEHRDAGTVTMMGPTAKFMGTPAEAARPSPALGEHTEEILLELGFSREDYDSWKSSGIIS